MIESFSCEETESIFRGRRSRRLPPEIQQPARRKLVYLNEASDLADLRSPPGNRLEALKGTLAGQYSIRINQQWRICFRWHEGSAHDVRIIDYH
jgi:proteic killer suppression protein